MAYSAEIYDRALGALAARRLAFAERSQERRSELLRSVPGLDALEKEIASLGVRAARSALAGADGEVKEYTNSIITSREKQRALLAQCGFAGASLAPEYCCERCRDTGFLADGGRCECLNKLLEAFALEEINRASPLELSDFESFSLEYYEDEVKPPRRTSERDNARRVLAECRRFSRDFPAAERDLLLVGDAGLGKTHLALATANETLRRGFDVVYCSAAAVMRQVEAEYFERGRSAQTLERLKGCELLVLDDLGTEYNNAFTTSALYDLINTRLVTRRRTIYTSNLTDEKAFERRYTEKIMSRLLGGCAVLPLFGTDIRRALGRT